MLSSQLSFFKFRNLKFSLVGCGLLILTAANPARAFQCLESASPKIYEEAQKDIETRLEKFASTW